jgi:predicted ATPase with chaperone activity
MLLVARDLGIRQAAMLAENAAEGACVEGMDVLAVRTLKELMLLLNNPAGMKFLPHAPWSADGGSPEIDVDDISRIKGQHGAKRAGGRRGGVPL